MSEKGRGWRAHLNSLWSMWYGVLGAGLQAFLAFRAAQRCLSVAEMAPWDGPDLHAQIALTLTAVSALLLPFFLATACCRVGNVANDGFKLGRHLSSCALEPGPPWGPRSGLWRHGGPTAPFLHLASAFCLLLPRLLLDARLIQLGLLPHQAVWRTDLDFVVSPGERQMVLSFLSGANLTQPLPSPAPDAELTAGVSPEFVNYAAALLVYAVRYPAVFWHTNKAFGLLFSAQLLVNALQSLLAYAGVSVLYKVQVVGLEEVLPLFHLRHGQESPFLLNSHVTLALFILSSTLILASSLVLYLYGYGRFNAFLHHERERRVIAVKHSSGWGYFTHCAALCVLLALAVCQAPLLHDYTILYRSSLDGAVLVCVISAIVHLFLWVLLWLILTIKRHWIFKLRVTIGKATVRSARSVTLVTDVHLLGSGDEPSSSTPLIVLGNGRTYTVADVSPKKAIMSVIQKAAMERKAKSGQGNNGTDGTDDGDEQIYWLRPKPPSPKTSPDSSDRLTWFNRKSNSGSAVGAKHKVTFDESLGSGSKKGKSLLAKSPKCSSKGKNKNQSNDIENLSDTEDDGDYATLRELPMMSPQATSGEDTLSEDNKLLDSCDDSATYVNTNPARNADDYEDPSPLLTPEPNDTNLPVPPALVSVAVHNPSGTDGQQGSITPRCLRRADSGMPHDELTPRSDSVSSGSGGSPPCGNHSETSSGVHSNSSTEPQPRRSTSVDDLTALEPLPKVQPSWRSFSLQRNMAPPTSSAPTATIKPGHTFPKQAQPIYNFGNVNAPHQQPQNQQFAGSSIGNTANSASEKGQLSGCPVVLLENASESTVVIRRKQLRTKVAEGGQLVMNDEPFGRSTNMRMTSFTDTSDNCRPKHEMFPSSSSTLPHYPTQSAPVAAVYPHCSTMPLPSNSSSSAVPLNVPHPVVNGIAGGSCHSFPRPHTTIPTHHNGVRLFASPNPFVKRFPPYNHQGMSNRSPQVILSSGSPYGTVPNNNSMSEVVQTNSLTGHHTFPHISPIVKHAPQYHLQKQDRDSANFSMASSGDSDQYLPHT